MRLIDLREDSLDVAEVVAALDHDAGGGLNLFIGTVRDHDKGREVTHLDYSAHPTAAAEMRAVAGSAAGHAEDLHRRTELVAELVERRGDRGVPVSYTHLTLPTN